MTTASSLPTKQLASWILAAVATVIALGAITTTIVAISYRQSYQDRLFPGVRVLDISLGGLTRAEAQNVLDKALQDRTPSTLKVEYLDHQTSIATKDPSPLIRYDVSATIDRAYAIGRNHTPLIDFVTQIRLRQSSKNMPIERVDVDQSALNARLEKALSGYTSPVQDASLALALNATSSHIEATVSPETLGKRFNLDGIDQRLKDQAKTLTFATLSIPAVVVNPQISADDIRPLLQGLDQKIGLKPLKVTAEKRDWVVEPKTYIAWYEVTSTEQGVVLRPNAERAKADLSPLIAPFIREAKDGSLTLETNASGTKRLKEFVPPVEGVGLDIAALQTSLEARFAQPTSSALSIPLVKVSPKILGKDAEELGIVEALGTGRSNFSGSPSNRRRNIKLGEERVHGTLVAPGEEFSMLKTLGAIDGAHGWLPELVIKGNKTTPEFGGGLCQIGTTAFRTALEAGMPITERRNHSYRVRYYEPAGTDATIYDPAPDFKFRNDTNHWILISGDLQGNDVAFTIWGTSDGRVANYTTPKVYNIVAPPPTKYIETTEIPVGTTKCTEVAHAGAEASFDYTVVMPGGETRKETFHSKYRPWQAVCLKGVASLSPNTPGVDETGVNNPN